MTVWTFDEVEHRFHEAAATSYRLPEGAKSLSASGNAVQPTEGE